MQAWISGRKKVIAQQTKRRMKNLDEIPSEQVTFQCL